MGSVPCKLLRSNAGDIARNGPSQRQCGWTSFEPSSASRSCKNLARRYRKTARRKWKVKSVMTRSTLRRKWKVKSEKCFRLCLMGDRKVFSEVSLFTFHFSPVSHAWPESLFRRVTFHFSLFACVSWATGKSFPRFRFSLFTFRLCLMRDRKVFSDYKISRFLK